ncbi:hypothetical protein Tco_1076209 [Tanacetum coccineum]
MAERQYLYDAKIWGLETFSNSIHCWRKDYDVIPRGVAWKEVLKRAVDEVDVRERAILEKIIKAQEQKIDDMQRHLLSLEKITKQLNTKKSDVDHNVDHLDKNGNGSENVVVGGLDHQSMEGVSQCLNVVVEGAVRE